MAYVKTNVDLLWESAGFLDNIIAITLKTPAISKISNTSSGITLKWKSLPDVSGYYIYRKPEGGNWKKIATVEGRTKKEYTDKTVKSKNGTVYYYTIAAYLGNTVSAYNESGKKMIFMSVPKLTKAVRKSTKTIKLKWKRNKKANGYQIQYSLNAKMKKHCTVTIKSGKTTSNTLKKLKEKKTYYVRIRSYKKSNGKKYYSGWSNAKKVTF